MQVLQSVRSTREYQDPWVLRIDLQPLLGYNMGMDVLSALKNVAGLAKKISDIPLQQRIIDLQNSYLEAQEKHHESKE